jgi:hypothetical protein
MLSDDNCMERWGTNPCDIVCVPIHICTSERVHEGMCVSCACKSYDGAESNTIPCLRVRLVYGSLVPLQYLTLYLACRKYLKSIWWMSKRRILVLHVPYWQMRLFKNEIGGPSIKICCEFGFYRLICMKTALC